MNTTRWRKRRNASNAITVAQRSAPTMPTDPVEATTASMKPVMPGRRSPASHRTTASSQTVTATPRLRRAGPKATLASVTRTTAAATHHTPVGWILRGSGGGAPVGRRRRPDRRTASSPDRADPTSPGSTGRGWTPSAHPATRRPASPYRRRLPCPPGPRGPTTTLDPGSGPDREADRLGGGRVAADEDVDRCRVDDPVPRGGVPEAEPVGAEQEAQRLGLAGGEARRWKPLSSRTGRDADPYRWWM